MYYQKTKYIEINCHFIREKIKEYLISTGYMKTEGQLNDIFTNVLDGTQIKYFHNKLSMINIYVPI